MAFLAACGGLSVLTTLGIVGILAFEAFEFFREVSIVEFLTSGQWSPFIRDVDGNLHWGVSPLVAGTMQIVVLSFLVGVPLGIGSAIYLSEYASVKVRRRIKPTLEILAGMPTVVLGYFALTFVSEVVILRLFGADYYNGLAAGVTVGIMIVPIIASVAEDAMAAVPRSLREGAYALGSSKLTVSVRVVLPAALSGVMAAVILGISRAIGETMIVAIAAGSTPRLTANPLDSIQTLTGYIVQAVFGDIGHSGPQFTSIFAVGGVLFVMTLVLNVLSQRLVRRFRQVY
jgi:phosphate transport system permease protein